MLPASPGATVRSLAAPAPARPSALSPLAGQGLRPGGLVAGAPLPANLPVAFDLVLRPRDPEGLARYATAVATPGSPLYHHVLDLATFERRFGATGASVATVEGALRAAGVHDLRVDAGGLVLHARATVATAEHAFSTRLVSFLRAATGGRAGWAPERPLELRSGAAGEVAAVVGLDSLATPRRSDLVVVRPRHTGPASSPSARTARPGAAGGPHGAHRGGGAARRPLTAAVPSLASCPAAAGAGLTPADVAGAYGLDQLSSGASPDTAAGVPVAVIGFAPYLAGDVAAFAGCYGIGAGQVRSVVVDGGAPTNVEGSIEADLDVEELLALAPAASITVYDAPNTDVGSMDAFTKAVGSGAKVITTSWGLCEPALDPGVASAEDTLFQQAAALGETVIAASGDSGSEDCASSTGDGRSLAVDDPASQPFVTGVGGTTLDVSPRSETGWGTGGYAGGGGISSQWPMPAYQSRNGAPAPGVVGPDSSGEPCGAPSGALCREVPDVAADAGTPYGIYATVPEGHASAGAWVGVEGTSGAAPVWAALVALADASVACAGHSVGFANPTLYDVAAGPRASTSLTDVTGASGPADNSIDPSYSHLFPVGPGYDMATGLGSPLAGPGLGVQSDDGLVSQLCDGPAGAPAGAAPAGTTGSAGTPGSAGSSGQAGAPGPGAAGGAAGAASGTGTGATGTGATGPGATGTGAGTGTAGSSHPARPVVLRLRPARGPAAGGIVVVLHGSRLGHPLAVYFGGTRARLAGRASATRLRVVAPPGHGRVAVRVETTSGTSRTPTVTFTYASQR